MGASTTLATFVSREILFMINRMVRQSVPIWEDYRTLEIMIVHINQVTTAHYSNSTCKCACVLLKFELCTLG